MVRILLLGASLLLSVCALAQKTDDYLKTLTQGDRGTLYFVKPIELAASSGKMDLLLDFSFVCCSRGIDSTEVVLNCSVLSKDMVPKLDTLQQGERTFPLKSMYTKKRKRNWDHRYTANIPLPVLLNWLEEAKLHLQFRNEEETYEFSSDKEWEKASELLRASFRDLGD